MRSKVKGRKLIYRKEENDDSNNRRILYLLFILLLTGILLSTTTYAWFTTNRMVSVNSLDVKVNAAGGIEISADGSEWKAMLDIDDLTSVHNGNYPTSVNQLPSYLEPTSTGGDINDGKLVMYYGEVTNDSLGNYILTASRSIEEEGNGDSSSGKFLAFDLFLKTTESKVIYLTSDSKVTYQGDNSYGIENAVRIAFILEGNTLDGSGLGTIQSLSTNDSNNVYIWEPNYDTHTAYGVSNALNVYGVSTSTVGGTRIIYDGIISDISSNQNIGLNSAKASLYSNLFKTVDVDIATINNNSNNTELFQLASGITKVRVYLWIEGQDVDCENNASVGDISFKLQFTTNPS